MAENEEFNALEFQCYYGGCRYRENRPGSEGVGRLLIDQAMNRHISNDGVRILLSLRAIHSVARMIVEIPERQGGVRV